MVFTKIYVAPVILGIWFPLTFTTTYIVAVCTHHVRPILPYISDTGTWAPESCIFGIMLTFGGFLTTIIVYVRYRQVRDILEKFDFTPRTQKVNEWTAYLGCIAAFGCIIVADFQVTNVFSVHLIGAFLCFGLANVYQIIQVDYIIYIDLNK
nr:DNA damage-regulated autophagy modulator protein 2-like [Leptinotarsa decemlineata]